MSQYNNSIFIDLFGEDLDSKGNFYPTSAETKILVTLRFLASNSFQEVIGDTFGLSKSTVNEIIWQVIPRIAAKRKEIIRMPTGQEMMQTNLTGLSVTSPAYLEWSVAFFPLRTWVH